MRSENKAWLGRLLTLIVVLLAVSSTFGQYCVGYTKYTIINEDGKEFDSTNSKKVVLSEFDGAQREIVTTDDRTSVFYRTDGGQNRHHTIDYKNGISVYFGYCGQINDMTLEYSEMRMKLIFEIGIRNTNVVIEALPFQDGNFKLESLECADGNAPPRIDNENHGTCFVPSGRWKKVINKETESGTQPNTSNNSPL